MIAPDEQGGPTQDEIEAGGVDADGAWKSRAKARADEIRSLKTKMAEMEEKLSNRDMSIDDGSDEATRKMGRKVRQLEEEIAEMSRIVLRKDGDDVLEPYLEQVLDENPELLAAYPNRARRLEAARVMAEGLRSRDQSPQTRSQQGRNEATPRVHLSGSGSSANRRSRSTEDDFAKFQEKMRAAKTSEERKALADKYDAEHPE